MSHTVSSDESMEDAVHFRSIILPHIGRPAGWLYKEECPFRLNEDFFDDFDSDLDDTIEDDIVEIEE